MRKRLEIGVTPIWHRTLYNLVFVFLLAIAYLKIIVVVEKNRALTVLRPSEANYPHRGLEKV